MDYKGMTIFQKILKPIGKKIHFKYPPGEVNQSGTLIDRVIISPNPDSNIVTFWDVVDLIDFPDEPEREWMRIGYYRQIGDRLIWGSQTTITEPLNTWKRILTQAAKEKTWFRNLLYSVIKELEKEA